MDGLRKSRARRRVRTRVALFLSLASLAGLYGLRLLGMVLRVSGLSAVALSTAGTLLCFLLPALAGLFMLDGDQHRMIALRALSAQHMLCLAAAGALFIGPAALLAELPGAALRLCGVELAQTAASAPDSGLFLPMLLQSALLAPICEELFFRGYLMGAFARAGRGKAAAADSAAVRGGARRGCGVSAAVPLRLPAGRDGAADRLDSRADADARMLQRRCAAGELFGAEACGKLAAFLRAGIDERGALLCDGCARLSRAGEPRARRMGRCAEQKGNGEDCRGRAGGYRCRNRIGGDETVNMALICMGRLKEKYWRDAANEYEKRLSRFGKFEEIELPDLPEPANSSPAVEAQICEKEGKAILQKVREDDIVIALCIGGRQLDSVQLSEKLMQLGDTGRRVVFIIGGSLGLSPQVVARANFKLSFSLMTFPHQLARVMLLEQTYRAMKIAAGEKYHK